MGITLIIAVSGAVCPLNAESHRRRSQGLDSRFPQPAVVSLTAGTAVALVLPVFLCGQARVHDLDRLRCLLAAGHPEDGATDHVWWMCFTRRGPGAPCARTKRAQEPLALTADPTSQVRGRVVLDLWTLQPPERAERRPACLVPLLRRWTVVVVVSVMQLMPAATGPLVWFAAMVLRFVSRTTSQSVEPASTGHPLRIGDVLTTEVTLMNALLRPACARRR